MQSIAAGFLVCHPAVAYLTAALFLLLVVKVIIGVPLITFLICPIIMPFFSTTVNSSKTLSIKNMDFPFVVLRIDWVVFTTAGVINNKYSLIIFSVRQKTIWGNNNLKLFELSKPLKLKLLSFWLRSLLVVLTGLSSNFWEDVDRLINL